MIIIIKRLQYLFFQDHNLYDEAVVDPVMTGIIHMRKSFKSQVKRRAFMEEVLTRRVPVLQVFSDGSLDLGHRCTVSLI